MRCRPLIRIVAPAACLIAVLQAPVPAFAAPVPAPLPYGLGRLQVGPATNALTVFTYKPANYQGGPLLVVFHGVQRNAQDYCRFAIPLADRAGLLVAAPLFDTNRFSNDDYLRGGVLKHGLLQPQAHWTFSRVPELVSALRQREGIPALPCFLLGHSGGAQFLMRLAALQPVEAQRIVVANPGSDLFPRRDWAFGYGFGRLPEALSNDAALRRYLAAPLTLYLGQADTDPAHPELDRSAAAEREGPCRLERGRACFEYARQLARQRGWTFGWSKIEVPNIGHDARAMLQAPQAQWALGATR